MSDLGLDDMGKMLFLMAAAMPMAEQKALEAAAKLVQAEAKAEIGTYQGAAGPFAAWAPLAASTLAQKANGNTPLLETGEMRDSIEYTVEKRVAYVGSNEDKAVWQELGTDKIPPRSFLGGAAVRKENDIYKLTGRIVHSVLTSGGRNITVSE